jgi:hypothetical protein
MAHDLINVLQAGTRLNQRNPLRNGNTVCFPGLGDLVVAGDLHNHRRNFQRVQAVAALDTHPDRHVILQEIVHGGLLGADGGDHSLDLLLDAIVWADQYPGQVHFLLANHDLAQVYGHPIMKDGYDLTDRFAVFQDPGGDALCGGQSGVSRVHADDAAGGRHLHRDSPGALPAGAAGHGHV